MSQQVQELIDKIKKEGTQVAEDNAKQLEKESQQKAQQIIDEAQAQSTQMLIDAKLNIKKVQESGEMALQQASRDTLLALRKSIEDILQKVLVQDVKNVLSGDQFSGIICDVVKSYLADKDHETHVSVSPEDLEKLKNTSVSSLQKELKKTVVLQSSHDLSGGFTLSFDNGKSKYDFSDESLADFLGSFVNNHLAEILTEVTK